MNRSPLQIVAVMVLVLPLFILSGCTRAKSQLAECSYEVEKIFANEKAPSDLAERLGRELKVDTLISRCMEARGFAFNTARSNENSAKKKYSGVVDSVMDDGNWDHWWLAKLTHKESQ